MVRGSVAVTLLMGLLAPAAASADDNDLVLSRLGTRIMNGNGELTNVIGQNLEFRALASQMGVALAPRLLTPADTTGFGGFQLTVDYATTTVDGNAAYWRARQGTDTIDSLSTVGVFARKGMWFPVPSFEIGGGAVKLLNSSAWTGQLYAKLSLVEGYHQLPVPSLSVRGAVSRLMSQRELDLTVASLDVLVSKHFGIGGTWKFVPFAGWNLLMIVPRSEVIDPTPNIDSLTPGNEADSQLDFVFNEQDTIFRNRFIVGTKFQYSFVQLTVEAQFAMAGSSVDDRVGTNDACMPNSMTSNCDAKDTAAAQRTISMSAGFDF
jgi:hypothetical protein